MSSTDPADAGVDPQDELEPLSGPLPPRPSLIFPLLGMLILLAGGWAMWRYADALRGNMPPAGPEAVAVYDADDSTFRGFAFQPPRPAPDFELIGPGGEPFRLSSTAGDVRLLFFGFTHCPDVCPLTLSKLAAGLRELGEDASRVQVVFVSVDPERDTPERIATYVEAFHPRIIGLTGDPETLAEVAAGYNVSFEKEWPEGSAPGSEDYTVIHSGTVFMIDQSGDIRASFLDPLPEDLAHDLRVLLDEAG